MRVGTDVDLNTDNPWAVEAGSDWSVVTTQYDMLLKFDSEDLAPAPSLATGCEPNADSTEWICTLRDGLKWSDGSPLTSSDVAFSYRFVIDHQIPQYRSYFAKGTTFETPDEHTLVWKSPTPTFAPDMPPWAYIVPEAVWAPLEDASLRDIREAPNTPSIGSGPFTLTEWNQGRGWTMERNPYYWGAEPAVDRIEYTPVLEPRGDGPGSAQRRDRYRGWGIAAADRLRRGDGGRRRPTGGVGLVAEPGVQLRWPGTQRRSAAGIA